MLFSVKSTLAHVLLILSALAMMLLIAWMALQLTGAQLDWFGHCLLYTSPSPRDS